MIVTIVLIVITCTVFVMSLCMVEKERENEYVSVRRVSGSEEETESIKDKQAKDNTGRIPGNKGQEMCSMWEANMHRPVRSRLHVQKKERKEGNSRLVLWLELLQESGALKKIVSSMELALAVSGMITLHLWLNGKIITDVWSRIFMLAQIFIIIFLLQDGIEWIARYIRERFKNEEQTEKEEP